MIDSPNDIVLDVTVCLDGLDVLDGLDLDNIDIARALRQVHPLIRITFDGNKDSGKTETRIWIDLRAACRWIAQDCTRQRVDTSFIRWTKAARPRPRPQPQSPVPASKPSENSQDAAVSTPVTQDRPVVFHPERKHVHGRKSVSRKDMSDRLRRAVVAYMLKQPAVSVVHAALRHL